MTTLGMQRTWLTGAVVMFLLGSAVGCRSRAADQSSQDDGAPPGEQPDAGASFYEGYEADIEALRKTSRLTGNNFDIRASSGEAIEAAHRVFANIDFVGMTKAAALELLGEPATISDYGIPAEPGDDEPLAYRFDHGFGGVQYTLICQDGKVVTVETLGLH